MHEDWESLQALAALLVMTGLLTRKCPCLKLQCSMSFIHSIFPLSLSLLCLHSLSAT
jgi:hypothetical protein